jgi:prepilin-type N-terminal cleavage/methylation domain-containing protein
LRRQGIDAETGFSLAEILVTVAIVGITFTAILGGLMTSIKASALQRTEATADSLARSAAEWVKDSVHNGYQPCPASYSTSGLTVPGGYSVTITQVEYWTGTTPVAGTPYSPVFQTTCPGTDHGLERITIVATSSNGDATERVQILKRVVS